ncbi:uncharacterized protein LOC121726334 [Aricia agestis]|uniref:uncharacterized protein LOC121726334 n=1 Tax=Aricia agestis TaxID=91739 RepID=UPI001C2025AF|nr:uncharacterized protein LOC121726334 [Aricia agestis]
MNNTELKEQIQVDLNIGDQLTTISCGHIVNEMIKFIAYQRLQIPYTYQWLKQLVNKRKDSDCKIKESLQSERHFHVASTALSNLDFILKGLSKEIQGANLPEEICIALGATPVTCKEMYRLILPEVCHKPQCQSEHIANDQKIQRNVFRLLATSEELGKVFFESIAPTNMYIFIKKKVLNNQEVVCSDDFIFLRGYRVPNKCKVVNIDFKSKSNVKVTCCNNFDVFGDISEALDQMSIINDKKTFENCEFESTDDSKWFQSSYVMKGFKDCFVNGSSVTNSWT